MSAIYRTEAGGAVVRERYAAFLAHWPVPHQHLRIPTTQGETLVIACGPEDGPALMLLHGSAANSSTWLGDVATWAKHFRVYAVDMIGEPGFSAPARPPLASGAYAPGGVTAYVLAADGPPVAGQRDAMDLLGEALSVRAALIAIPVARLGPGFLTLRTRIAGEVIQKFINYGFRVVFLGDVSDAVAASDALRDFIRESNRGRHVSFVADMAALEAKLAAEG